MRRKLIVVVLVLVGLFTGLVPAAAHTVSGTHHSTCASPWSHPIVNDGGGYAHKWYQVEVNGSPDHIKVWITHYRALWQPESGTWSYTYLNTTTYTKCFEV